MYSCQKRLRIVLRCKIVRLSQSEIPNLIKPSSRSPTTAYYVITARYRSEKTANSFEGKIVSSTSQLFAYMIGTANLNLKLIIFLGLSLICMLCYDYNLNTLKLTVLCNIFPLQIA